MYFKITAITFFAIISLSLAGCAGNFSSTDKDELKQFVKKKDDSNISKPKAKPTFQVSLASPKDTYKSRLKALADKDEAALYLTFSKGFIELNRISAEFKQKEGKEPENFKFWGGESGEFPEIFGEKIEENRAYLQFKPKLEDGKLGFMTIYFIKEENDWKIATMPEYREAETQKPNGI